MEIRLLTPVSSRSSKRGTEVAGVVVAPVRLEDRVVIPSRSVVRGTVKQANRVGLGFVRESAKLVLDFTELELAGGQTYPIQSRLISVDNARERVDRTGAIRGIRATASLSHRLGFRVASLTMSNPAGFVPLLVLQTCLFKFPNPEIEYGPGTDMQLQIDGFLSLGGALEAPDTGPELTSEELAELEALVAVAPYWSYTTRQQRGPMDIINLVFVGSRDALDRAFTAAGWTGSRPISAAAGLHVVRALAEYRAYPDAPMHTLLVDGAEPDTSWQKALNTLTKRHHLRIWKRPERWRGRPVWLSAATHDISVGVSLRLGFTHQIHSDIDHEREKVLNDLRMTGCVDAVAHVRRPEMLRFASRGDGKVLQTDGAVAAVVLNSCESPEQLAFAAPPGSGPGVAGRFVRRVNLSARNHFIRNNLPWQISEASLLALRTVRKWQRERLDRSALAAGNEQGSGNRRDAASRDGSVAK
ncbi:MAG: LssY C-terminal domain-containing protein [Acidobacteria bacterium]|nr:LssY C-terminal domain-containing protein [Acidobacteriota bacterium]